MPRNLVEEQEKNEESNIYNSLCINNSNFIFDYESCIKAHMKALLKTVIKFSTDYLTIGYSFLFLKTPLKIRIQVPILPWLLYNFQQNLSEFLRHQMWLLGCFSQVFKECVNFSYENH